MKRLSTCVSKSQVVARTHDILNTSQLLLNYNTFNSDPALKSSIAVFSGGSNTDVRNIDGYNMLEKYGFTCGAESTIATAKLAEKNKPILKQYGVFGHREDTVDFHPSYHSLMSQGIEIGSSNYGYNHEAEHKNAHLIRAALIYMQNQVDPGHCCPLVMTNAAIPVLSRHDGYENIVSKLTFPKYDHRNVPMSDKQGITAGMSMTEKQGGSDVRANTTMATPIEEHQTGNNQGYYLKGHKWFTSAPMCDVFLTLAKTKDHPNSPSCFLVPRWLPDGTRNEGFKVMRLKDKCADRSNASSEVEYDNAYGTMVGDEGKGVKTIIEMVQSTRLDCALGSAGMARRCLLEALNYTSNRSAFGEVLINQPLMQNVLADLCVESEAHTVTSMRMAQLYSDARQVELGNILAGDNNHMDLFRISVAVSKFFITKRLPQFAYECMESFGGNGFVDDFPMAELYRHAPLNSIWEGSGNVMVLDVLRAHKLFPLFLSDLKVCVGANAKYDRYVMELEVLMTRMSMAENGGILSHASQRGGRHLVDCMAICLEASLLMRYGSPEVADMFIQSRIDSNGALNYGVTEYSKAAAQLIIDRNMPSYA